MPLIKKTMTADEEARWLALGPVESQNPNVYRTSRGIQSGTMPAWPMKKRGNGAKPQERYANRELRLFVYERDAGQCQYCGCLVSYEYSNIDHVVPWNEGGRSITSNLVLACKPCNKLKGRALIPYELRPI